MIGTSVVERHAVTQYDWIDRWLEVWARFERTNDLGLDIPDKAIGFQAGGFWGYVDTLEQWEQETEARAAAVINAAIESMSAAEASAVRHMKLRTVYPFGMETLDGAYHRAKMQIGIRLHQEDFS